VDGRVQHKKLPVFRQNTNRGPDALSLCSHTDTIVGRLRAANRANTSFEDYIERISGAAQNVMRLLQLSFQYESIREVQLPVQESSALGAIDLIRHYVSRK
jgi:hypothetical protein